MIFGSLGSSLAARRSQTAGGSYGVAAAAAIPVGVCAGALFCFTQVRPGRGVPPPARTKPPSATLISSCGHVHVPPRAL